MMAVWVGWVALLCLMVAVGMSDAGLMASFFVGGALVAVFEWLNNDAD